MKQRIENFLKSENGAVSAEWVVLTVMIIGLGIAAFTVAETGSGSAITASTTVMSNHDATSTF